MIDDKVTSLKNIRQKNLPYMITWILYYAWIGAFMTWWTASPMTDRIYGTDSRVLLHSLLLFSSAVVVLFFKPPTFVKYSRIGAIVIVVNSLLFYITYMVNAAPIVHSVATVILALSLGIVNISVFIPLCYVLNNTEKFYAIIGTNFLIVILAILQETNVINERIVFSISFAVLIGSIVPIYWFRETHYEEERIRCEKHIPKKPKSIYFTIALNMLYACFCKSGSRVFVTYADNYTQSRLFVYYYLGGMAGCLVYYLIYKLFKKCNDVTWNVTFSTFVFAMVLYIIYESEAMRALFSFIIGIGSTMGMINMYYILCVIAKKYWDQTYVKASIMIIGLAGGLGGIALGKYFSISNNITLAKVIMVSAILIVIVLMSFSSRLAVTYYRESWEEDSTMTEIDNCNRRKLVQYKLTEREIDVCNLLLENLSAKQIAVALDLTENTINSYKKTLYKKLDVTSKDELVNKINENM